MTKIIKNRSTIIHLLMIYYRYIKFDQEKELFVHHIPRSTTHKDEYDKRLQAAQGDNEECLKIEKEYGVTEMVVMTTKTQMEIWHDHPKAMIACDGSFEVVPENFAQIYSGN